MKTGELAPSFVAGLWDGNTVDLASLRGKKVWLAFFRYAACPLCNLRVHEMIQRYSTFRDLGIEIVAVFQSPKESISEYVGKQKPPFPLVSDPNESLYKLYGVRSSLGGFLNPANLPLVGQALQLGFKPGIPNGTLTRIPADFLIDAEGVIQEAFYGEKIGDHIPIENVVAFAKKT